MTLTPEEINIQHDGAEDDYVYPELELTEVIVSREGDIVFIEDQLNDLETYTLTIPDVRKLYDWIESNFTAKELGQ